VDACTENHLLIGNESRGTLIIIDSSRHKVPGLTQTTSQVFQHDSQHETSIQEFLLCHFIVDLDPFRKPKPCSARVQLNQAATTTQCVFYISGLHIPDSSCCPWFPNPESAALMVIADE
jgi:hypothetical protein